MRVAILIGRLIQGLTETDNLRYTVAAWHFLYFFPEPHGHGSLRPTLASLRFTVCGSVVPLEKYIGCCFGFGGAMRCTRGCSSRSTTTSIFHRYLTTRS